jgi:hypothetical protein
MESAGIPGIAPRWKVYQDSSWEGGAPAILRRIPPDDEIKELYNIYIDRHIAAPAPGDSSTGSLFDDEPNDSPTGNLFDDYE